MSSDADKLGVPPPAVIKVVVIEDHREFRDYLAALISGTPGFRCAGSYRSMEEALAGIRAEGPDAALIHIRLPRRDRVEGTPFSKGAAPRWLFRVKRVSAGDERIFDARCAGASGSLLKKPPPARLIESLREAVAGGAPMSPEVARRLINLFREIRPPERADYNLTPHELRLLKLLVEGHNYKTAAAELNVTPSTINFHLQKIYEKLQVHSKSEAVAKALRNRLV